MFRAFWTVVGGARSLVATWFQEYTVTSCLTTSDSCSKRLTIPTNTLVAHGVHAADFREEIPGLRAGGDLISGPMQLLGECRNMEAEKIVKFEKDSLDVLQE